MARNGPFDFDYARHWVASALRPEHVADFQRLIKRLRYGSHFQLLFAEFTEASYRNMLMEQLDHVFADLGQPVAQIDLSTHNVADLPRLKPSCVAWLATMRRFI
ncbi:MAG: hypothetical protein WBQ05_08780 [Candidatus Competibacter denitrificans]